MSIGDTTSCFAKLIHEFCIKFLELKKICELKTVISLGFIS